MSTWKNTLAVIIIFALGTIFGLVLSRWIQPGPPPPMGPDQVISPPKLNLLFEQDLTPEQKRKISRILESVRVDLDRIRERIGPEIHKRMLEAQKQIRDILTPEQQVQFDRILQDDRLLFDRPFRP